ncbi:RNA polymerase sigma factor [Candidatus Latescibacterota bacterium]
MTDHDTMLAVRNGDIEKMGMLFEKHHKHLYNFFRLVTRSREMSEDLVNDVFYRMLKYRHTYRPDGDFKPWMFAVARNARIEYLRSCDRKAESLDDIPEPVSSVPGADKVLEREDDNALVRKALAALPEDKRELLIMSRYNHMKYREIGEALGCSEGTVKVRVHRAVKDLADIFFSLTGDTHHGMH